MLSMNVDQCHALVELKNTIHELGPIFRHSHLNKDQLLQAYEKILVVRCSANLVKSYVLDRLEEEDLVV
jgi:hypothetical protein